jgi:hypothetical protein
MQVTILTSEGDVKRTRRIDTVVAGSGPKAARRTPFGRIVPQNPRDGAEVAFPGRMDRKRFAAGLGWGIIRAHGNKQTFGEN